MLRAVLLSLVALVAVANAGTLTLKNPLPANLQIADGKFTLTLVANPTATWKDYTYELTTTTGGSSGQPAKISTSTSIDAQGVLTVMFDGTTDPFTKTPGKQNFADVKLTMTSTDPKKQKYNPYQPPTKNWAPTTYALGTLTLKEDLPMALVIEDKEFQITLQATIAPTKWSDYKYALTTTTGGSGGKSVPISTSTSVDDSTGVLTVTFDGNANPFSKPPGKQDFAGVLLTMTAKDASKTPQKYGSYAPKDGKWTTTTYAEADIVLYFDGTPGGVDLTQDFTFKVCRATGKNPPACIKGLSLKKYAPQFYVDDKNTTLNNAGIMVNQATSMVSITPYSAFTDQVKSLTMLYIAKDATSTPQSIAWTPRLTGGATMYDPYILATKGNTTAKLVVTLKDGVQTGEKYTIDFSGSSKPITIDTAKPMTMSGSQTISLTNDDVKTAGNSSYANTLMMTSNSGSAGLINIFYAEKNTIDLFVVDAPTKATVTGSELISNWNVSSTFVVHLAASTYPPIEAYQVKVKVGSEATEYTGEGMGATNNTIDVSTLVTSSNNEELKVDGWYMATVKTTGNSSHSVVIVPETQTPQVTTDAVYMDPKHTPHFNVTLELDACKIDYDIVVGWAMPHVTFGSCTLFTDMTNMTIDGTFDANKNQLTINGNIPLDDKTVKMQLMNTTCEFGVMMTKKNVTYYMPHKDLSMVVFETYQANPMSKIPMVNATTKIIKNGKIKYEDPVQSCVSSYYRKATAECNNGRSVVVIGDGNSWTWMAAGNISAVGGKTNLTETLLTTCGSASIFPAALVVAAAALLNLFK